MRYVRSSTIAAAFVLASIAARGVVAQEPLLPDAPGRAQVMESCMQCHGADIIVARPRTPDEWSQTVSQMIGYGAALTDEQYQTILTYLSTNLKPREAAAPAPNDAKPAPSGVK